MSSPSDHRLPPVRSAFRPLAALAGFFAALAAIVIGALMALFFAATMVVTAVLASAVVAFVGAALKARRSWRPKTDPALIEARNVGGHHWVAYGWDGGR